MFVNSRILVVDDEPLVLELFSNFFSAFGIEHSTANSGAEALRSLQQSACELLVCDVGLGDLDGFSVASFAIRRQPSCGVILVTGSPNADDEVRARTMQIEYLVKPVNFANFIERQDNARIMGETRACTGQSETSAANYSNRFSPVVQVRYSEETGSEVTGG